MDTWSWEMMLEKNLEGLSWVEGTAALLGILSAWCIKKEWVQGYPVGIVSIVLYVYVCWTAKLYANMGINMYYMITSAYGWYHWTHAHNHQKTTLPIRYCSGKERLLYLGVCGLLSWLLYEVLGTYTDSVSPLLDGGSTAVWMVAAWLMANKRVEHWIGWLVGDTIAIPLYISQGLLFSGLQFLAFLIIASMGLRAWHKSIRLSRSPLANTPCVPNSK